MTQWAQVVREELLVDSAQVGIPVRKLVRVARNFAVPLFASWVM